MTTYESKYDSEYDGSTSYLFKKIRIPGKPRTQQGEDKVRCTTAPATSLGKSRSQQEKLTLWKKKIIRLVQQELVERELIHNEYYTEEKIIKDSECNMYMVFRLSDQDKENSEEYRKDMQGKTHHNPYRDKDLDNLVKAAWDAIRQTALIEDDRLIKGIKAYKEPTTHREGMDFQCLTTKTFTIHSVIKNVKGEDLMPGYWQYDMQYITAIDTEGNKGTFIDNMPPRIFIARDSGDVPDAVPGYDWKTGETVSGCLVFKRTHTNPKNKESKEFYWLHKWQWW